MQAGIGAVVVILCVMCWRGRQGRARIRAFRRRLDGLAARCRGAALAVACRALPRDFAQAGLAVELTASGPRPWLLAGATARALLAADPGASGVVVLDLVAREALPGTLGTLLQAEGQGLAVAFLGDGSLRLLPRAASQLAAFLERRRPELPWLVRARLERELAAVGGGDGRLPALCDLRGLLRAVADAPELFLSCGAGGDGRLCDAAGAIVRPGDLAAYAPVPALDAAALGLVRDERPVRGPEGARLVTVRDSLGQLLSARLERAHARGSEVREWRYLCPADRLGGGQLLRFERRVEDAEGRVLRRTIVAHEVDGRFAFRETTRAAFGSGRRPVLARRVREDSQGQRSTLLEHFDVAGRPVRRSLRVIGADGRLRALHTSGRRRGRRAGRLPALLRRRAAARCGRGSEGGARGRERACSRPARSLSL